MSSLRTAVVGVGYLGKFHADKFAQLENAELVGVCDTHIERAQEVATKHNTKAYTHYKDLLGQVDAVSIVVPTAHHYSVAKLFLEAGVHVLLEKPMTDNLEHAQELIDIANKNKLVFQIGHLERFNSVITALDDVLDNPRYIEAVRLAPFKPRGIDVSVILDLMIHDIDIIQHIVGTKVIDIQAWGTPVLSDKCDVANARLQFENGCVANISASRVSFKTERKCRIFQPDAYIVADMHDKKIFIHRKGSGEMFPGVSDIVTEEQTYTQSDALLEEIKAFLTSIEQHKPAVVTGEDGMRALSTALKITDIIQRQAEEFRLSQPLKKPKEATHVD